MIDDCDLPTKRPEETPAELEARLRSEGVDVDGFLEKVKNLTPETIESLRKQRDMLRGALASVVGDWEFDNSQCYCYHSPVTNAVTETCALCKAKAALELCKKT